MAWIGLAEDGPHRNVQVLCKYGDNLNYLATGKMTWDESERGNGPTGLALRSGEVHFSENISTDPAMAPWRQQALSSGYQASIALPFRLPDGMMACLTLYSALSNVWSSPERALLQEIAIDLAIGISTLRITIEKSQ